MIDPQIGNSLGTYQGVTGDLEEGLHLESL